MRIYPRRSYRPIFPDENFPHIRHAWEMIIAGATRSEALAYLRAHNVSRMTKLSRRNKHPRLMGIGDHAMTTIFRDPFYYGVLVQAGHAVDLKQLFPDFKPVVTEEEVATAEALPEKAFVPSVTYQLDTFYFENGSSFLDADYRERIRKIVRAAKKDNAHVRVVGHASSRTNDTDIVSHKLANFKVSQKRAEAVAEELRRAGMPAELISVEALSDSAPAYLEVMPEGERLNRRVEVFLSY